MRVLFLLISLSTHDAQVSSAILKAAGIDIPSLRVLPTWK